MLGRLTSTSAGAQRGRSMTPPFVTQRVVLSTHRRGEHSCARQAGKACRAQRRRHASLVIRFAGPGAIGPVARYATRASTSNQGDVTRPVPTVNPAKPSPPLARKSFMATWYEPAGSIAVPLSARLDTRCPSGLVESYEYVNPADTCRILVTVCPPYPANCCSSTSLSWAPV